MEPKEGLSIVSPRFTRFRDDEIFTTHHLAPDIINYKKKTFKVSNKNLKISGNVSTPNNIESINIPMSRALS